MPESTSPAPDDPSPPAGKRPFWKNPWLWGVVALIALDALFRFTPLLRRIPDPPDVVCQLPEFALVRADGSGYGRHDLAGAVHIVGLVSTGSEVGGEVLGAMVRLQQYMTEQEPFERFGVELKLTLVATDLAAHAPADLALLAASHDLDPGRWTLLTGPPEAVETLARGGFGPALQPGSPAASAADVFAAGRLAIVDGDGGVRGFYALDDDGRDEVFWRALRTLRDQRPRSR